MNELLKFTIEAHGGLDTWRKYEEVSAHLIVGGITWGLKQQAGVVEDIYVRTSTKRQFASHSPFINQNWRTSFESQRVAIETTENEVVEELLNPRDSFSGHKLDTPWTRLQLAYFAGYAMWTYLNAPFNFAEPGYSVQELTPWEENGEVFRRLQVNFPKEVATHGAIQTFYIDGSGLIKRHDYNVDVLGGAGAAHYLADHLDVQGIKVPTKRLVYVRQEDNTPLKPEPLLVSIDLSEIKFK